MYDHIARFYDLTHANLTDDIPLILKLAAQAGGSVLELGCGSGRLLLPLVQAGHTVTGLDLSGAMLARARAKLGRVDTVVQQRITLHQADMTTFELPHDSQFGLAIVPYNTLFHLETAQVLAMLRRVREVLEENGRLFIDLANPVDIANTPEDALLSLENVLTDPETGDLIVHLASNQLDTVAQTLHITWIYDVSAPNGGPVQRMVATGAYHYRYPHQLELLLQEAGFKLLHLWGEYDQSSYTETSNRLLVLAAKNKAHG
ncbi:class I SAM-dependent methyltransferase [Candidatus Leptofilum sp.]|uniref:class I SAM-dependent methyltransferase n=1 Tax=Candidatus Leptofilum sp. TaxID=3241576 RepID=UPI003B5C5929